MNVPPTVVRRRLVTSAVALVALVGAASHRLAAQDADLRPDSTRDSLRFANTFSGEFTPGAGFSLIKTEKGTLNVSAYGLFRYMNQYAVGAKFTDHLGQVRPVQQRNDLNWQRTFAWLTGWFYTPKFRYNITFWSLPTTQQTLLFGNLHYRFSPHFVLGVGIGPNLTARSVQGQWPFFAATDRQMAEDFFRGGFSSGVWLTGEAVPRLYYTLSINNNISQLGVTQANDSRNLTYSGTLKWLPTTGEFGPRGGFGDLEYHSKLATQLGMSIETARETRAADVNAPPNTTQIRLSDGVIPFETGALARGVTVARLTYDYLSFDAGAKYRGFSFQSEYYFRRLNDFVADGPLPLTSIFDQGLMAEAMQMVVPKTLGIYGVTSYVWDDFKRRPWEVAAGASYYPSGTRSWRINLHMIHVVRSPAGSFFGYYTAGQTGTTFSLATDILL